MPPCPALRAEKYTACTVTTEHVKVKGTLAPDAMVRAAAVQFMGICKLPPCVVTEYCARGSLADVLRGGKQGKPGAAAELTWRRRLSMALDAATGMLHLHARTPPIIHRDLKSPNLLVDVHWRVKVILAGSHFALFNSPLCTGLMPAPWHHHAAGVRLQHVEAGGGVDTKQQLGSNGEPQ